MNDIYFMNNGYHALQLGAVGDTGTFVVSIGPSGIYLWDESVQADLWHITP